MSRSLEELIQQAALEAVEAYKASERERIQARRDELKEFDPEGYREQKRREREQEAWRRRTDEEYAARVRERKRRGLARHHERLATDPEYKAQVQARDAARRTDPHRVEQQKEYRRRYYQENKERLIEYQKEYSRERYANDPEFRKQRLEYARTRSLEYRERYKKDPEAHRRKKESQARWRAKQKESGNV